MLNVEGYILRITRKEWVNRVFDMAIYYTGVHRKWKTGQTIIFVHKTGVGDAVIGYGKIGSVYSFNELSEEEKQFCKRYGWKEAIEFEYVISFENPLPLRETFLKELKLRGKTLHGFPLNKEQISSIIDNAEHLQTRKG